MIRLARVDLGSVEQVARALRRDLGVIRQDDRRGEKQVRLAVLADEDGPRVAIDARLGGVAGSGRRVGHRHEPSTRNGNKRVAAQQRAAKCLVATEAGVGPGSHVLDPNPDPDEVPDRLGAEDEATLDRPAGTDHAAGDLAFRPMGVLDEAAAAERERDCFRGLEQIRDRPAVDVDMLLGRLVPGDELLVADIERRDRREALGRCRIGRLDAASLELKESHPHIEHRLPARDHEAFGLHLPVLGTVQLHLRPRREDAELEANAILVGRGTIGIEDVALVEDGVGDLLGGVELHAGSRSSAPARSSSMLIVSSHVVSASRPLNR